MASLHLWNNSFSDEAVRALRGALKYLRILNFSYIPGLTNVGIKGFMLSAKLVSSLTLRGCHQLTEEAFLSIANRPKSVQQILFLDISYCRGVTDTCIMAILHCCGQLATLKLQGNTQITDMAVMGARCPSLTDLDISETAFSDAAITWFGDVSQHKAELN